MVQKARSVLEKHRANIEKGIGGNQMTKEQAKKITPIIQAYAEDKLPSDAWECMIARKELVVDWHVAEEEWE
jgi:hypothetical protein